MEKTTYQLVTELCEIFVDKRKYYPATAKIEQNVKQLRIRSFEILLHKRIISGPHTELEKNTSPYCHLLAWHHKLSHDPNQSPKAAIIKSLIIHIKKSNMFNDFAMRSALMFLIYLKNDVPYQNNQTETYNLFNIETLKLNSCERNLKAAFGIYPSSIFILPNSIRVKRESQKILKICSSQPELSISLIENIKINNDCDVIERFPTIFNFRLEALRKCKTVRFAEDLVQEFVEDDYCRSVLKLRKSIWELVVNMPICNHRNWEYLGHSDPVKELPFATESKPKTIHYFQKLLDYHTYKGFTSNNQDAILDNLISQETFIKKLKDMLVGITSDIFPADNKDIFHLKEGVYLESLSGKVLQSYCFDLLECGSCYRSLNGLCFLYSYSSNEKYGLIFKELCNGVSRYLKYYRAIVLSLPNTTNLLTLHSYIRRLKNHIIVLASLCKIGIFSNNNTEPDKKLGVELLNFMYQEILKTTDKDVSLVLYSVFCPCCQIYFSRFLQQWLFEGVLRDPYEEFFIKSELTYLNSRSRIYWTRGFSVKENNVPEFLLELKHEILQCGKYMNLLRLCKPNAVLFSSTLSRTLPLMTSCFTSGQLNQLRQEIERYYDEMTAVCGPCISLEDELRDRCDENLEFLNLVEKMRIIHLKKFELKKQEEVEQKAKQKKKLFEEMKEQMMLAIEQKQKAKEDELRNDLLIQEENVKREQLRSKQVEEERKHIAKYYGNLIEAVDRRRENIETRKKEMQDETTQNTFINENISTRNVTEKLKDTSANSENEIVSNLIVKDTDVLLKTDAESDLKCINETQPDISSEENMENSICNKTKAEENLENENTEIDKVNANIKEATNLPTQVKLNNDINETFLAAKRNKAKILNLEFDMISTEKIKKIVPKIDTSNMTEAQRNKMRVLSSEFDIFNGNEYVARNTIISDRTLKQIKENVNINVIDEKQATAITDIIPEVTENLASPGHENVMNIIHRKSIIQHELPTILETNVKELDNERDKKSCDIIIPIKQNEIMPMSIDSTPITELPTPSSMKLSLCTENIYNSPQILDSALLTTNSSTTDDGFKFPYYEPKKYIYENAIQLLYADKSRNLPVKTLQLNRAIKFTKTEIKHINNNNIKLMLYQSVILPLEAQIKLVNNEILSYFVHDQKFFSHLHSLRCYYFLLDGEFGRRITEGLFNKLYEVEKPVDLLNCRTLQAIIDKALYASCKTQENGEKLSFIIQNIPNKFDLSSVEVLDCLSLSYRMNWPINILLPVDTIEKYDQVFKYLLKLHHMSWLLQKIFEELKFVQKAESIDYNILMLSPQYHQIQLFRYIMSHFVQTLQNYTVSQVLQTSWKELEKNMKTVSTLDQLYTVHTIYVKTIMFRCLLNKKCMPIRRVITEIFAVILKFYNYLRSSRWLLRTEDHFFTHPNFKRLEEIFHKFEEFANFIFRVGNKMARVGYQPHLIEMLDMLNMNSYYTIKQNV